MPLQPDKRAFILTIFKQQLSLFAVLILHTALRINAAIKITF